MLHLRAVLSTGHTPCAAMLRLLCRQATALTCSCSTSPVASLQRWLGMLAACSTRHGWLPALSASSVNFPAYCGPSSKRHVQCCRGEGRSWGHAATDQFHPGPETQPGRSLLLLALCRGREGCSAAPSDGCVWHSVMLTAVCMLSPLCQRVPGPAACKCGTVATSNQVFNATMPGPSLAPAAGVACCLTARQ